MFLNLKNFGYSQILQKNKNFTLYKLNKKRHKTRFSESFVYDKFLDYNSYLISKNNNFFKVKKKSDWIKAFPESKPAIQLFFKNNKSLLKSNPDQFMNELFKTIN